MPSFCAFLFAYGKAKMKSFAFYVIVFSLMHPALGQPTADEGLTDVETLTNKLELLTDVMMDLNKQLKQVWYCYLARGGVSPRLALPIYFFITGLRCFKC